MYELLRVCLFIFICEQLVRGKSFDKAENTNILDEVIIDLKSKLYPQASDRYLYTSNYGNEVAHSHLHSTQMNASTLSKYFEIVNKTNVAMKQWPPSQLATARQNMCADVKQCDRKQQQQLTAKNAVPICLLDLNLILYMTSRQIKLVNVGIILNDLSDDYLRFDKASYEFNVDPSISYEIG